MEKREKIIAALKGKWPVAEWVEKDDWDDYHCSNCRAWGNIEDRFCGKCGSFMKNYEPERRYHYNCKHCGASLDGVSSYSIVGPDTEPGAAQVFIFECPACGEKSEHTFDDARVEVRDDGFDEQFLIRMEAEEPRVLRLAEIKPDVVYWREDDEVAAPFPWAMREYERGEMDNYYVDWQGYDDSAESKYNVRWRCWSSKPTTEQMGAVPWNE